MTHGRLGTSISLGGTAVICCIHGAEKNKSKNLVYDAAREKPAECICCGNVFSYAFNRMDTPLTCPACTPGGGNV